MLAETKAEIPKPDSVTMELHELLSSKKVSDRESAVRQFRDIYGEKAVDIISNIALHDANNNLRKLAVMALDSIGTNLVIPALLKCLEDESEPFIKKEIILALGHTKSNKIVNPLLKVLDKNPEIRIGIACIDSLLLLSLNDAIVSLTTIQYKIDYKLLSYLIKKIGDLGNSNQASMVEGYIDNKDENICLAALTALSKLLEPTLFVQKTKAIAIGNDYSVKVKSRIAELLKNCGQEDAIKLLCELLFDSSAEVRNQAKDSLAGINSWESKLDIFIPLLEKNIPQRSKLDANVIIQAIANNRTNTQLQKNLLAEKLIITSTKSNKALIPVYASLIVSVAEGKLSKAGEYIDQTQRNHKIDSKSIDQLRVEVGGKSALRPMLLELEESLNKYFQEPIHTLNEQTKEEWKKNIEAARIGFMVRMSMSVVVFLVGMVLLTVASYQFLFNDLSGNRLWGSGISFISGFGAMLLVIYTGPLKDIRQAISDMGASNAAFIAYIHRILQISHTFSAKYLSQNIDFDDTRKSCELISEAMLDTVSKLEFNSRLKNSKDT